MLQQRSRVTPVVCAGNRMKTDLAEWIQRLNICNVARVALKGDLKEIKLLYYPHVCCTTLAAPT